MPGPVGFTRGAGGAGAEATLRSMQDLVAHEPFHRRDGLFIDDALAASRVSAAPCPGAPQPRGVGGLYIWFDGEIFEPVTAAAGSDQEAASFLARVFAADEPDLSPLAQVDGIFTAVAYDPARRRVHLVTDRYGYGQLFWHRSDRTLAWGGEVKAMLALPGFRPEIDPLAVADFFRAGFLGADRTWLAGVEILPAAGVLTYDFESDRLRVRRYWGWDRIRPLPLPADDREIVEELGRLFLEAVRKRCQVGRSYGITLSGGLDSRAILAAVPDGVGAIHAFTFGRKGCPDLRIAAAAAALRGVPHHVLELDSGTWLGPRIEAVWRLDGHLDVTNLHAPGLWPLFRERCDVHLSGFLGDATVGGSYISRRRSTTFEKLEGRGRRLINEGARLGAYYVPVRRPFMDNAFLEFALALPDAMRAGSMIYNRMLLHRFPEYFAALPWQRTGAPIGVRRLTRLRYRLRAKTRRSMVLLSSALAKPIDDPDAFAHYPRWWREQPARGLAERLLLNPDALYREFLPGPVVERHVQEHMAGRDRTVRLGRYVTFEVWLQQLFRARFRSGYDRPLAPAGRSDPARPAVPSRRQAP